MELLIVLTIFSLIIYFMPVIIANHAGKKNTGAIFVFNLFLGWTFIGWVVALVWAFMKDGNRIEA